MPKYSSGFLSQLLGGCCKVILCVQKRCKWVADRNGPLLQMGCSAIRHRMQLGCSAVVLGSVPPVAQMQRGCIGMHKGYMCLRAHSTVVHTWCTRTLCSNLVRMATVTWADTPWSNPWGVLYPSRVTTPFLSYSFMNLWIGELVCLV